ncbi:pentapeptide repeat-containing protein [Sunxiuqinia dokdonensis]|nr:pentapeptide repeat-containing protein [Sunxiuqinia dokdonensis]
MIEQENDNEIFQQVDFSKEQLAGCEFIECRFVNCSFSASDLTDTDFLDCSFEDCDFTLVKLNATGLKDVCFKRCKLMGFDFTLCSDFLFQVEFDVCQLDYALFTKKKMKKTTFRQCSLVECDFTECQLTESVFDDCILTGSTFYRSGLTKADFRTAIGFSIDPDQNHLKKARFSQAGLAGLLEKYDLRIEA